MLPVPHLSRVFGPQLHLLCAGILLLSVPALGDADGPRAGAGGEIRKIISGLEANERSCMSGMAILYRIRTSEQLPEIRLLVSRDGQEPMPLRYEELTEGERQRISPDAVEMASRSKGGPVRRLYSGGLLQEGGTLRSWVTDTVKMPKSEETIRTMMAWNADTVLSRYDGQYGRGIIENVAHCDWRMVASVWRLFRNGITFDGGMLLSDVLKRAEVLRVENAVAVVDGHAAIEVEFVYTMGRGVAAKGRLWIDEGSKAFAWRSVQYAGDGSGRKIAEYTVKEIQRDEVTGAMLPKRAQGTEYVGTEPARSVVFECEIVGRDSVVPRAPLAFAFPPGTVVDDRRFGLEYKEGAAGSHLDVVAVADGIVKAVYGDGDEGNASTLVPPREHIQEQRSPKGTRILFALLAVVAAGISWALCEAAIWRKRCRGD